MRLIDADARIDDLMERSCKECDKRKGMKNGKRQFIYEIGGAPCRACEVDDVKAELEEAPTIDAVPVVRCKDCKYYRESKVLSPQKFCFRLRGRDGAAIGYNFADDDFCSYGERSEE